MLLGNQIYKQMLPLDCNHLPGLTDLWLPGNITGIFLGVWVFDISEKRIYKITLKLH